MDQLAKRLPGRLAVIGAVAFAAACGGGSPTTPATPTPVPTPASVTTVVSGGSSSDLQQNWDHWVPFTTTSTGRLEGTVDWTFATDDVEVMVATGRHTCTNGQYWDFSTCNVIASIHNGSKPKKFSLAGQPAGTYTLYILNNGPATESVSWQVLVTTPG
ncbi:MAG TPA: hypothetical protein VEQ10_22070 [Vicinamibacteria bacterium]|nr:hypothetical protein [Vicinamibacteria bacterium]